MKNQFKAAVSIAVALMLASTMADAPAIAESQPAQTALQTAIATAERFHQALSRGDSATAARLLAADAVILESGDRETRAEYLAAHLGDDIEFAKAVMSARTVTDTHRQGDVVWLAATTIAKGKFHDREVNSRGAELVVMSKTGTTWKIRAIHWSSHRLQQ